jgi:oligopeptide transport system substrate-binding protein
VKQSVGLKEISSPKETIASGPFILSEYKPEQVVKLVKNEKYFGEKPLIDGIERKIVKDSATRLNLFKNGETDFTTLEKQDWKSVRSDPKYSQQIKYVSRPAVFYILLSGKAYTPFQDREVRKSVAMAIDRQRITSKVLGGIETAKRWLPEGLIPIGPVDLLPPFNPEMARATLAKTKYKSGSSLPELELMVRSDNADARFVAESIANDLEKNLGLKVKPKSLEWGAMLKARNRGELPSAILSWYGDYLDPQNFLSLLLTTNASANFDKWSNPEFDKLCASADVEQNEQKRMGLYVEAEKLLMQDVPRIPIYHGTDFILVSNRVEGLRNNLLGMMPHTKVRLR